MSDLEIPHITGAKMFADVFDVSRESLDRLGIYEELLRKWQKIQNLVSQNTMDDIWHRHIADSAQLMEHCGDARVVVDLGSGAGFPGLVLAILFAERGGGEFHLIESHGRKCAFLREVVRQTGLNTRVSGDSASGISVEIHNARIEELGDSAHGFKADLITARALASLSSLLHLAQPFFSKNSRALFLKGRDLETEIKDAQAEQPFHYKIHESRTDRDGQIIEISDFGTVVKR